MQATATRCQPAEPVEVWNKAAGEPAKFRISMEAARVNARLTQDEAAKILHVTKQTLINWEKGRTEPKTSQAEKMAEVYGVPYDNIIFLPAKTN